MIVYNRGDRDRKSHTLYVCPVGDEKIRKEDAPSDWLEGDGKPKTFEIEFKHGRAEVDSNLADYLVRAGLACRTALILPTTGLVGV